MKICGTEPQFTGRLLQNYLATYFHTNILLAQDFPQNFAHLVSTVYSYSYMADIGHLRALRISDISNYILNIRKNVANVILKYPKFK